MGERMVVQFARGARKREDQPAYHERSAPRPRRTLFRMSITGLPVETSWQVSNPKTNLESFRSWRLAIPGPQGHGGLLVKRMGFGLTQDSRT